MMKQMRENTKVILWIVVVAFVVTIFAVWGLDLQGGGAGTPTGQYNILGKVNGITISREQYQITYRQMVDQMKASMQTDQLTYAQQEMLQEQAWQTLVTTVLTEQEIEKMNIGVTDEEIVAYLRTSPPPEIQRYFVDENGNFDFNAYQEALNNPDADWTSVEALARRRIPMLKLNRYIASQVHVSPREIRRAFEEENTYITAEYVSFPIGDEDVGDYSPSDEEINAYYDSHSQEYRANERAAIEYVKIPIEPTPRDFEDVNYTTSILTDQIATGEDFGMLARTYSEAFTAAADGETGFITAALRDSTVMNVVATMDTGQISQPIQTDNGVYLVKLLDTKVENGENFYNIQEIFVKTSVGAQTIDSLASMSRELRARAEETSLAEAAEKFGLAAVTTEPFQENFPITGIGFIPAISRFAFNNPEGTLSNILGDENSYYICRVTQRLPEELQTLEEVRPLIESTLRYERQKRMALRKAEAFRLKITSTRTDITSAANEYGYTVNKPEPFRLADNTDDLPAFSALARACLDLAIDTTSPPVESHGAYHIARVTERSAFDEELLAQNVTTIGNRLRDEKLQSYIIYWYDKLKEEAEIEDYRDTF